MSTLGNKRNPILCLDFDGVCHSYISGWKGAGVIPDPPVEGLFEFLDLAKELFTIVVFSSRSNQEGGILAMKEWFGKYFTEYLFAKHPELAKKYSSFSCPDWIEFPTEKPVAFISIDDRAITFTGKWPNIDALKAFVPWYKRKKTNDIREDAIETQIKEWSRSWYQLQRRSRNQPYFMDYDAPIPVDKDGAADTAFTNYHYSVVTEPDYDWRMIIRSESIISGTDVKSFP